MSSNIVSKKRVMKFPSFGYSILIFFVLSFIEKTNSQAPGVPIPCFDGSIDPNYCTTACGTTATSASCNPSTGDCMCDFGCPNANPTLMSTVCPAANTNPTDAQACLGDCASCANGGSGILCNSGNAGTLICTCICSCPNITTTTTTTPAPTISPALLPILAATKLKIGSLLYSLKLKTILPLLLALLPLLLAKLAILFLPLLALLLCCLLTDFCDLDHGMMGMSGWGWGNRRESLPLGWSYPVLNPYHQPRISTAWSSWGG